jgi:hypothetical protein
MRLLPSGLTIASSPPGEPARLLACPHCTRIAPTPSLRTPEGVCEIWQIALYQPICLIVDPPVDLARFCWYLASSWPDNFSSRVVVWWCGRRTPVHHGAAGSVAERSWRLERTRLRHRARVQEEAVVRRRRVV